uniref:Uncharacterized protein n=1 Tax=Arundo donax TaxID=35708 RepID=A0A0A9Q4D7_ARUDO
MATIPVNQSIFSICLVFFSPCAFVFFSILQSVEKVNGMYHHQAPENSRIFSRQAQLLDTRVLYD